MTSLLWSLIREGIPRKCKQETPPPPPPGGGGTAGVRVVVTRSPSVGMNSPHYATLLTRACRSEHAKLGED